MQQFSSSIVILQSHHSPISNPLFLFAKRFTTLPVIHVLLSYIQYYHYALQFHLHIHPTGQRNRQSDLNSAQYNTNLAANEIFDCNEENKAGTRSVAERQSDDESDCEWIRGVQKSKSKSTKRRKRKKCRDILTGEWRAAAASERRKNGTMLRPLYQVCFCFSFTTRVANNETRWMRQG